MTLCSFGRSTLVLVLVRGLTTVSIMRRLSWVVPVAARNIACLAGADRARRMAISGQPSVGWAVLSRTLGGVLIARHGSCLQQPAAPAGSLNCGGCDSVTT